MPSPALLPLSPMVVPARINTSSWPHPIPQGPYHANQDLIDRRSGVALGWSARAASTLAIEMFIMSIGRQTDASSYSWPHEYRQEVLNLDGHLAQEDDMKNLSVFKWKLVLNPFHRAVSSYDHQMYTKYSNNSKLQQRMFNATNTSSTLNTSFVQWLRAVEQVQLSGLDIHSQLQTSDFESDGQFYDLVCHVELLNDCVAALQRAGQNFTAPAPGWDTSNHDSPHTSYVGSGIDIAAVPYATFEKAPPPYDPRYHTIPDTRDFYSEGPTGTEAQALVARIYAADFARYNYSMSDANVSTPSWLRLHQRRRPIFTRHGPAHVTRERPVS